jgi:hypothetical protein
MIQESIIPYKPEAVRCLIEKMLDLVGDKTPIDQTFKKGQYCFRKFERPDEMVIGWKKDKLLFHYEPYRNQNRSPYRVMDAPETWLPFVLDIIQRAERLKNQII